MTDKQEETPPVDAVDPQDAPSPGDMGKLMDVAQAGDKAAKEGGDVAQARKDKRDEVGLPLPDEEIDRIAGRLMDMFRDAGAFDPALEPVAPPAQPAVPPAPGEQAADAPPPPPAPTRKPTFAERFMGVG